jgi:hypothetical protein
VNTLSEEFFYLPRASHWKFPSANAAKDMQQRSALISVSGETTLAPISP